MQQILKPGVASQRIKRWVKRECVETCAALFVSLSALRAVMIAFLLILFAAIGDLSARGCITSESL
jgi:hypothetical protein